jgi:preprotein translocase subunit SecG
MEGIPMPDGWWVTYVLTAVWCLFGVVLLMMKKARENKKQREEDRKRQIIEETQKEMESSDND